MSGELMELQIGNGTLSGPEEKGFLMQLYHDTYFANVDDIKSLYENDFAMITEKKYSNLLWPSIEEVEEFYNSNDQFHPLILALYKELYYRHLFSKCGESVSWVTRRLAWENYVELIMYFVEEDWSRQPSQGRRLSLPASWLWDMLDELVYQYQDTARWIMREGSSVGREELCSESRAWSSSKLEELLSVVIQVSGVREWLYSTKDDFSKSSIPMPELKYIFGYCAIVNLARVYVMRGDYYKALEVLSAVEISNRALYWRIPACHLTMFYNIGFSYMMLRRHNDVLKTLSPLLLFLLRQKSYISSVAYQQNALNKIVDRMLFTIMLSQALTGAKLEESLAHAVKEKFTDKFYRLQQDKIDTFRELFGRAAPKFINPVVNPTALPPDQPNFVNKIHEPHTRQLNLFLKAVNAQKIAASVLASAKLYNNIPLTKLASFWNTEVTDLDEIHATLMAIKVNSKQLQHKSSHNLLSGEWTQNNNLEIHIMIDLDVANCKNNTQTKVFSDIFVKQLHKAQELYKQIRNTPPPTVKHLATISMADLAGAVYMNPGHNYQDRKPYPKKNRREFWT